MRMSVSTLRGLKVNKKLETAMERTQSELKETHTSTFSVSKSHI